MTLSSTCGLPVKLEESERHRIEYEMDWRKNEALFTKENLEELYFLDSKGNKLCIEPNKITWVERGGQFIGGSLQELHSN